MRLDLLVWSHGRMVDRERLPGNLTDAQIIVDEASGAGDMKTDMAGDNARHTDSKKRTGFGPHS